jgi:hypothetical protein
MKKLRKRCEGQGSRAIGGNRTIDEVKVCILRDMRKFLKENRASVVALGFKIKKESFIGKSMFDDYLFENLYYKYFPVAYDDLIEWTKQEPLLVGKIFQPSINLDSGGIIGLLEHNIILYLKEWFYTKLGGLLDELR